MPPEMPQPPPQPVMPQPMVSHQGVPGTFPPGAIPSAPMVTGHPGMMPPPSQMRDAQMAGALVALQPQPGMEGQPMPMMQGAAYSGGYVVGPNGEVMHQPQPQ